MIYIYTEGYDHDYNFFYFANPYLMPGITVNNAQRNKTYQTPVFNGSDYAGGASQGKYAAVGFILCYDASSIRSTFVKNNDSKIQAKKSYFMFDNEIVALGTGIKDTSKTEVSTIVENRLWRADDKLFVNGAATSPSANQIYTKNDITSMHFSNMGGYVFLDSCTVKYQKADGAKADFMEIWIAHGKSPNGEKYSYVYLPEATPEETTAYQANPDIEIISETAKIHAVKETKLGVTGYVFYEAGSVNGVTTDKALSLMVKEGTDGTVTVSVSDPTHLLTSATVTIELSSLGTTVTAPDNIEGTVNGNTLTLNIDFTDNVGESFTVTVK
jgi:hyaluronate lyase